MKGLLEGVLAGFSSLYCTGSSVRLQKIEKNDGEGDLVENNGFVLVDKNAVFQVPADCLGKGELF